MLLILALFPILCAPVAYAAGKRGKAIAAMVAVTAVELLGILLTAFTGFGMSLELPQDHICHQSKMSSTFSKNKANNE